MELFSDGIELKDESYQKIINLYVQEVEDQENNLPGFDFFAQHQDPDVSRVAVDMITSPHQLSEKWKKHFIFVVTEEDRLDQAVPAAVYSMKQALVNFWRDELMDELEVHNTDMEKATDLMTRIQALNTIRNRFAELLGTVVVE